MACDGYMNLGLPCPDREAVLAWSHALTVYTLSGCLVLSWLSQAVVIETIRPVELKMLTLCLFSKQFLPIPVLGASGLWEKERGLGGSHSQALPGSRAGPLEWRWWL